MRTLATCHPDKPMHAHGLCNTCYHGGKRISDAHLQLRASRLEDLTWMADTGESAVGAAARLGITRDALEKWCHNNDHDELYARLHRRDPVAVGQVAA